MADEFEVQMGLRNRTESKILQHAGSSAKWLAACVTDLFWFFFSPIHFVLYSDHVLNSIVLALLAITTKRVT